MKKLDIIEIVLFCVFMITCVVLKYASHFGLIPLIGSILIIGMAAVWILQYRNYTITDKSGNKSWMFFAMSFVSRMLIAIGFMLNKEGLSVDVLRLVATLLNIAYIVVVICKKNKRELLYALLYRLLY